MRMNIDRTFLPLIVFLILVVVLGFVLSKDKAEKATALQTVPDFSLADLHTGELITKRDLNQPWTVVNIWATWCSPCKKEHATLLELSQQTQIPILGINFKDDPEAAKAWLRDKGNPYAHTLTDTSGRAAFDWGVVGVPETLLIDDKGVIRQRFAGVLTPQIWEEKFLPVIEGKR